MRNRTGLRLRPTQDLRARIWKIFQRRIEAEKIRASIEHNRLK